MLSIALAARMETSLPYRGQTLLRLEPHLHAAIAALGSMMQSAQVLFGYLVVDV